MDTKLKESVATLFCHAIKMDDKESKAEKSLFCRFMGEDFDCSSDESKKMLESIMDKECTNVETHVSIISNALYNEPYKKMNILKQLNHIIFRNNMKTEDYDFFNNVKNIFFRR